MSNNIETQPTAGALLADISATQARPWRPRTYLMAILLGGAISLPLALVGYLAGELQMAGLLAFIPIAALILWRPEIGVFLVAVYVPFEYYGRLAPVFTLTKFVGLFTFLSLLLHLPGSGRLRLSIGAFWWAMACVAWALVSVLGALSPELSWFRLLTRIQLVGLLFIVLNGCQSEEQAKAYYWALFLGAAMGAAAAFVLTPSVEYEAQIARSTVGGININQHAKDLLSGIFMFPIVLLMARRWLRVLVGLAFLVLLVDLVRTGSRSTYIAVYAGAVVGILCYRPLTLTRRLTAVILLTAAGIAFVTVGTVTGLWTPRLWERMVEIWERGLESGGRLWMWTKALQMGAAHPIAGVGVGNFEVEMGKYGAAGNAHNDTLLQFAETGIPGLVIYLGFLVATVVRGWRAAHPVVRSAVMGLFVAAYVGSLANPAFMTKSFWLQMSAIVLAGTVAVGAGRRNDAPTGQTGRPATTDAGLLRREGAG